MEINQSQHVRKILDKKEIIFYELKKRGCRITNQRKLIIDIILEDEFSCCKEIYYKVKQQDFSIGIATVYRMIKTLEEIGAIDRKNFYNISCKNAYEIKGGFSVVLKSKEILELTVNDWKSALQIVLREKGVLTNEEIDSVIIRIPDCIEELYEDN